MGLGTGLTASAALRHAVREIAVYELVPEVAEGARTVFAEANLGLLEDPRVALVLDDARTHLRAGGARFDVIVGDLIVPWRRGESALLTHEHFASVRAALAPGGLFCQWLPLYQLAREELAAVAATFADVFPHASLWRGDFVAGLPALGLVGSEVALDPSAADARVRALAPELVLDNHYLAEPAGLWLFFLGALDPREPWLAGAPRNTRDRPWLELRGRRGAAAALIGAALADFEDELRAAQAEADPARLGPVRRRWAELGGALFRASALDHAGREEEARSLAFRALAELPPAVSASVLGPGAEVR